MGLLYFIITLIATTIGAIAGLGGGLIIKPSLDTIGTYDVATIGMLSSITVLSMSIVSTARHIRGGVKIDIKKALLLSLGAAAGGLLGKYLFGIFSLNMSDETAKGIQAVLLIALLVFVLLRKLYPNYNIKSMIVTVWCGLMMGCISTFLGIGGGPINVAIICIAFSISIKDAAIYSIFTIMFSQLTTVLANAISPGLYSFDLVMLLYMIPSAIIGALLGAYLNRRLTERTVEILFNTVIALLIFLNLFNCYRFLFA